MNFEELVDRAKNGDSEAMLALFERYRPLTAADSLDEDGLFDPDLWQEQYHRFLIVLQKFDKERALAEATGDLTPAPEKCGSPASLLDGEGT